MQLKSQKLTIEIPLQKKKPYKKIVGTAGRREEIITGQEGMTNVKKQPTGERIISTGNEICRN